MATLQTNDTITQTLAVPCVNGIHLRVAAQIVTTAKQFESTIWLTHADRSARARSILGLLELGATQGAPVLIGARGPDARQAVDAMTNLFTSHACGGEPRGPSTRSA